jgi:hypothetical protein
LFLLTVLKKRVIAATSYAFLVITLRPLFLAYVAYVAFLMLLFRGYQKVRQKAVFAGLGALFAIAVAHGIITLMDYEFVYRTIASERFSVTRFLFSSVGYGAFVGEGSEEALADPDVSRAVRVIMFDSLFVPLSSIVASIYLIRRGTANERRIAFILVAAAISLALSYMIVQGNYPMRKILPLFPLMYLSLFLGVSRFTVNREAKRVSPATTEMT